MTNPKSNNKRVLSHYKAQERKELVKIAAVAAFFLVAFAITAHMEYLQFAGN